MEGKETINSGCGCIIAKVIGIGGATRSGKSTVANRLIINFPNSAKFPVICQDYFFKEDLPKDKSTKYENWEIPESINMKLFEQAILAGIQTVSKTCKYHKATKEKAPSSALTEYIFVEGFLIFQLPLLKYFHKKIFISVDKETCKSRRMKTKHVPEQYFEKLVWPNYLIHNASILKWTELDGLIVDGTKDQTTIINRIIKFIQGENVESDKETMLSIFSK